MRVSLLCLITIVVTISSVSAIESANYKLTSVNVKLSSENFTLSGSFVSSLSESASYELLSSIWWYPIGDVAPAFVLGDLDGDDDVDFNDLIGVLNLILTGGYNPAGDIDGDGDIDFNDLIGVLNLILR